MLSRAENDLTLTNAARIPFFESTVTNGMGAQIAIILAITDVATSLVALQPAPASRPAVGLRMACDNDSGMSRRMALRSATASLVLGVCG